mmetsp:Transcript_3865/g.4425  ORF Transcript_3865/g.4425 Transcript_3865/m.4425 type:complete len:192 (+) Transcript_3865:100-675(+)
MYNTSIPLHPLAELNSPWLIEQNDNHESSLYLLEEEEKQYNSRLEQIANIPAPNPIGMPSSTASSTSTGNHHNNDVIQSPNTGGSASAPATSPNVAATNAAVGMGTRTTPRRSSGGTRTYTPRSSTSTHHYHQQQHHVGSSRGQVISPTSRVRPTRAQRHSSTGSGIGNRRSYDDSFTEEDHDESQHEVIL